MLTTILDYIRSKDSIVKPSALKLHFNKEMKIKTLFGGILSITITYVIIHITIGKAIGMVTYDDPMV